MRNSGQLRRLFRNLLGGLGLLILCLFVNAPAALADERIWSALVLATNAKSPKPPAPELDRFSRKVERFFGYNQLQLIGSATKSVEADCEKWLVPSQNFWLNVKAKQMDEGGYLLDLVLFHDKQRLVETKAKLGTGRPLIIRGPMYGEGQLLIVLQLLP